MGLAAGYLGRGIRRAVGTGSSVYFLAAENNRRVGAPVQHGVHARASGSRFVNFGNGIGLFRLAERQVILRAFDRILQAAQQLLQIFATFHEVNVRSIDHQ